jgi:hypothetical protein
MSWAQFENDVVNKMEANGLKSPEEFAKFFAKKYDECIKSGVDLVTKNKIQKSGVALMEELIKLTLISAGAATTTGVYDTYFNSFGNSVIAYWTGATLETTLTPLQPAYGSNYNIGVTTNTVTFPGTWPQAAVPPMKNPKIFVKTFITFAKIHLSTISGFCQTTSAFTIYNIILSGYLVWQGYKVPNGILLLSSQSSNMLFGGKYVDSFDEGSHSSELNVRNPLWQNYLGYDLFGDPGTPVYSPIEGVVSGFVDKGIHVIHTNGARVYGMSFTITSPFGAQMFMAHLKTPPSYLKNGFIIQKGQLVGEICEFQDEPKSAHLHISFNKPAKIQDFIKADHKGTFN